MSEEIVGKARSQAPWLALGQVASRIFQFLTTVILARLLLPEHFGKVALAAVVWEMVALLGNTGVVATLVQRRGSLGDLCQAAFWLNLAVAAAIAVVTLALAVPVARFYADPVLVPILVLYASAFLIGSTGTVHVALLTREVSFGRLALADTTTAVASGLVAILLAASGFGFWSLVIHAPAVALMKVLLLWRLHSFRPGLGLKIPLWREIFGYGRYILGRELAGYVNLNGDYMITGKILGEHRLGIYSMAYRLANYPVEAGVWLVSRIAFPTLSGLQDAPERLAEVFLKMIRVVALASFPAFAVLFVAAPDLIAVLYGEERWGAASPLIRILIPYVVLRAVGSPAGQALMATGRARTAFRFAVAVTPVLLVAVFIGAQYGLEGVAVATSAVLGTAAAALTLLSGRVIGVGWRSILAAIRPGAVTGAGVILAAGAASWSAVRLGSLLAADAPRVAVQWASLLAAGAIGTAAAWLLSGLLFREERRLLLASVDTGGVTGMLRRLRGGMASAFAPRVK